MRSAGAHEIARAAEISQHAEQLEELHDEFLRDLNSEAHKVQEEIDQIVLRQVRMHRYAVRVNDEGQVEKFLVLKA